MHPESEKANVGYRVVILKTTNKIRMQTKLEKYKCGYRIVRLNILLFFFNHQFRIHDQTGFGVIANS